MRALPRMASRRHPIQSFGTQSSCVGMIALCALVLYCCFAQVFFRIPWYVMLLALLAVPLVQIHATGSMVDLPTNLATAIVMLLAYRAYAGREVPSWGDIAVFGLAAAVSANMKFLHLALVSAALLAMLGRLAYWYRVAERPARRTIVHRVLVLTMAMPLIFATTIKNTVLHGNPVFPLKVSAFGITLPHTMAPNTDSPLYLRMTPQAIRWGLSVFEIRAFDARRPYLWTGEQGYLPRGVPADRMGGYFFVYVIGNLVLLGLVVARLRSREARMGGVFFALLPEAHFVEESAQPFRRTRAVLFKRFDQLVNVGLAAQRLLGRLARPAQFFEVAGLADKLFQNRGVVGERCV